MKAHHLPWNFHVFPTETTEKPGPGANLAPHGAKLGTSDPGWWLLPAAGRSKAIEGSKCEARCLDTGKMFSEVETVTVRWLFVCTHANSNIFPSFWDDWKDILALNAFTTIGATVEDVQASSPRPPMSWEDVICSFISFWLVEISKYIYSGM